MEQAAMTRAQKIDLLCCIATCILVAGMFILLLL
jgi:hypothetical protein